MKKEKILKIFAFIMPFVLVVMLSGCGANKPVSADISGIEDSENENQGADSPSEDSVISSGEASDELIEQVDNPDGGWTIFEYGETGAKVKESVYDADGKQIQDIVYSGSIKKSTTEYSYNEAGEQDKSVVYDYNANGSIWKVAEYDRAGNRTKTLEYTYNADGSIKRTTEHDYEEGGQSKSVDYGYDDDGILTNTSEYVAGQMVKYTSYNYTYYNNDIQIVGYTVEEYDSIGKMVDTTYFELDADVGQLVDADLEQQKETEHFVFYCIEQDIEVLDALAESLEGCYDRVTSDLGIVPSDKTKIYIYPNLKTYHRAIGRPDDPDRSIGEARDGCIYLVSPLNPGPAHTYNDMFVNAVHEFTHVVDSLFNQSHSSYLSEGIATYEAGQNSGCMYYVKTDIAANTLPSLMELDGWNSYVNMSDYDSGRAYAYGYVYIEFAVETSGFDTVISLLEGKSQTEAFGMSQEELDRKWRDFLASYGN